MQLNFLLTFLKQAYTIDGKECRNDGYSLDDSRLKQEVKGLCTNSAQAVEGGMFIALTGFTVDGHKFIPDAIAKGAKFIIAQNPAAVPDDVVLIEVADTRKALPQIAAAFFGFPARQLTMVGVTGTNGKTTTATLCESILKAAGFTVGVITTINWRYKDKSVPSAMTTPDALELQRILAEMRDNGVSHVVMEVSSHAIDLERITNTYFDVAALTNLSQDHLDYHGDMEKYGEVKARLFTDYLRRLPKSETAVAVINTSHVYGADLFGRIIGPKLSVAVKGPDADVYVQDGRLDMAGINACLHTPKGVLDLESSLIGEFNLENLLVAAGVGLALKLPLHIIKQGLSVVQIVRGRLERVPSSLGPGVFVDYAHTPDALENVLRTLKGLKPRRLLCVFGCGGNRDKTKRPLMGAVAVQYSDFTVVTSDNPRNEEPAEIINDILAGITPEVNFAVEPDRAKAIQLAIRQASSGDIVLIAGKGHENYQIIKGQTFHFDDVEQALLAAEKNYEPLDLDA